ncbi:MAG: regulatory signaling modulator protein AmpE [Gammaproteobacteria bacterium]|nr:regulatory signaling modulator protein AmpE [Gammaproteobacteria bacterium]
MTLIVIVAVLLLETFTPQLTHLRNHGRVEQFAVKWRNIFDPQQTLNPWLVVVLTLLPIVFVAAVLLQSQPGVFGFLFQFAVTVAIVFWSLGPKRLSDYYFDLHQNTGESQDNSLKLVAFAHYGFLAVLIWFVLLGPLAALLYRVIAVLAARASTADDSSHRHWETALHWADWVPVRVSCFLLMLTGNFASGFNVFNERALSPDTDNRQLLLDTAQGAMNLNHLSEPPAYLSEARHSCERSIILLTVLVALMSIFSW